MGGLAPQNYNVNPVQGFDQGLQTADALNQNLIGALKLREEMSNAGVKDVQNLYAKQEAPYNYLATAANATKSFVPVNPQRINALVGSEGNQVRNKALQMAVEFAHSPEETAKKYPMADIIQNPLINQEEAKKTYQNLKVPSRNQRSPQSDLSANNDAGGSMNDMMPVSSQSPSPVPIDSLALNDQQPSQPQMPQRQPGGSFADPASAMQFAAQVQPQDLISPEEEKIIGQAYGMQAGQIKSGLSSIARMSGINENDLTKMMIAQANNESHNSKATADQILKLLGLTIGANKPVAGNKGPKELSDQQVQTMAKQAGDDAKKSLGVMGQFASDRDPNYQKALSAQYEAMDNAKVKQKFYTLHKSALDSFYSKQPNSENKAITAPPPAPTQQAAPKVITKYINGQPTKFQFNPQTKLYDPVK